MIIGIALVVDELHKGQRLVYRYPESVPSSVLNSTEGLLKFHQDYQSLSPDNFAKLFRPKASLFNKILELTIDDLHYISFPCPCSDELSTDVGGETTTDVITLFNVVIATVRESAMKKVESALSANSKINDQRKSLFSKFETAGSDPVAAALGLRGNGKAVSSSALRRIVEIMSRALLNQEKRNRYVSRQIALLLRLQEESTQKSHVNQIQQNNNSTHEGNNMKKKPTAAMNNNSSNEISTSVKKKNRASDLQAATSTLAISVPENAIRNSQGNSLSATPTNRSSSILDIPATAGLNSSSSGALYPGIWAATPTRVASPPVPSMESGSMFSSLADKESTPSGLLVSSTVPSLANIAGTSVTALAPGTGVGGGAGTGGASVSHPTSAHNLVQSVTATDKASLSSGNTGNNVVGANGTTQGGWGKKPGFDKKLQVMESMQTQSSLANELRLVYHGLIGGHSVNLMVNNSLAINVRLSDDDDSTTSKTDLRSDRNTVSNRDLSLAKEGIRKGGMDNGNMTLLTIADEEEMIHLFTSMNASGSDTGLMSCEEGMLAERKRTVSAESARIARGGDPLLASIAVSAIGLGQGLGQGAGGGLDFPPNFNNPSSNSSSSSSGSSSGSPGNIHPDLKELISALDPTLSLEELSVSLEQPLREVFSMCRDLQGWGLGTFTPTITSDRKYKLNPRAPINGSYKVARTFYSVFQEPLKETEKYLEYEMNRAELDAEQEEFLLHKLETTQKLSNSANQERILTDESIAHHSGSSRPITTLQISSSPPTSKLPFNSPKSMFNFSHLNNPSSTKNEFSNSTHSDHFSIDKNEKYDDINNYKNEDKNKKDLAQSSSLSKNGFGRKSSSTSSDVDNCIEVSSTSKHSKYSIDYTLSCVLSVFDGNSTLEQAILKLPPPLRPFGVDMVVWLLRWRMIEEVGTYFLSLSKLNTVIPLKSNQRDLPHKSKAKNKKNYVSDEDSKTSASTSSSNSATDQVDQVKRVTSSVGIDKHNTHNMNLTEYERCTLSRLSPYFNGASSLHDIAWLEKLQEEEILRLVRKNTDILVFYA